MSQSIVNKLGVTVHVGIIAIYTTLYLDTFQRVTYKIKLKGSVRYEKLSY